MNSTATTGAKAALAEAIADLRPRLLAVARAMRADEPEDLVQSTIEIALRRSEQLGDPSKLWPWLVTIQTREMFRWSRRLRRIVVFTEERVVDPELATFVALRVAVLGLPPKMRAAVVLHHMAGMSVADTARALGTSENTIKTQLRTALRRLKESMNE